MTVGQRIAQLRKELGLSQEALGEQLGVSRQAIYKWESDSTLPEIEKLIALSKIFAVPVGWLLGVEEPAKDETQETQSADELTQAQLEMVAEIVRRYQATYPQPEPPKRRRWPWVLAVLILIVVFVKLFSSLNELKNDFNRIESSVQYIDRMTENRIDSITGRVEDVLNRMNSFTVEHSAEIAGVDLAANTITLDLRAVPKTYHEGMTAVFQAEYGDGVVEADAQQGENRDYTATLTCPLTDEIALSVVFVTGDKRETQSIRTYSDLYTCSFPVSSINTGPSFFGLDDDTLSYDYFHLNISSYTRKELPTAEIVQMRLGLFEDNKLVYWLEQVEEQPESFVGDWGDALFFYNPQDYKLNRNCRYSLALVVVDEYDREMVCSDIPTVYEADGNGGEGRWTYPSNGWTSRDPADWEY